MNQRQIRQMVSGQTDFHKERKALSSISYYNYGPIEMVRFAIWVSIHDLETSL